MTENEHVLLGWPCREMPPQNAAELFSKATKANTTCISVELGGCTSFNTSASKDEMF